MVLADLIGDAGPDLAEIPARYDPAWKPEADADSWISRQTLSENGLNTLRPVATMAIGRNVVDQAKSADLPYSAVRRKARTLGWLWTG